MQTLYRPVGVKELELMLDEECREFPARLEFQPIFYPVLNEEYAMEIASKWNTKDINSGFVGYVTKFNVPKNYVSKYEPHIVGMAVHEELWIPSEELKEFNSKIEHPIRITRAFYGENYLGELPVNENSDKYYVKLFIRLRDLLESEKSDLENFFREVKSRWKNITLNYILWRDIDLSAIISDSDKEKLLNSIKEVLVKNEKWFFTF